MPVFKLTPAEDTSSAASADEAASLIKARRKVATTVIITSVVIHLIAGGGAAIWIVAKYFKPPEAVFIARKEVSIPAEEREHKMNMAAHSGLTPKPALSEKLVSTRPTEFSLPDVPMVPIDQMLPLDPSTLLSDQVSGLVGTGGNGSGGNGSGGFGGTGDAMSFFGIQDKAKSVLIMVDVSTSMFSRTGDYDFASRQLLRKGKDQSFQRVRDEMAKLVAGLSINTRFNILRWSGGVRAWQTEMVPATDANKQAALAHIQDAVDVNSAGPTGGRPGGTRHDYALEAALALHPETIFLLSDGNATAAGGKGGVMGDTGENAPAGGAGGNSGGGGGGGFGGGLVTIPPKLILDLVDGLQKGSEKPARIHTIYYITGKDKDEERDFMRSLATRNSGKFRAVRAEGVK